MQQHGNSECQGKETHFTGNEDDQVPSLRTRHPMDTDPPGDDIAEVAIQMPVDRLQPVQRPEIKVLPAVKPAPSLMRRQPANKAEGDIGVLARDVDIGVMEDGVLPAPLVRTST